MKRGLLLAAIAAMAAGIAVAQPARTTPPDPARGKQLYAYWCATCHGRGPGNPGTQSLQVKYKGSQPAALEDRANLPPQVTTSIVRSGIALMPPFRKTEISDAELRDIAAWLAREKR